MNIKMWWIMKDFEIEISKLCNWLKKNILEVLVYKKEIEEFVYYLINRNDEY